MLNSCCFLTKEFQLHVIIIIITSKCQVLFSWDPAINNCCSQKFHLINIVMGCTAATAARSDLAGIHKATITANRFLGCCIFTCLVLSSSNLLATINIIHNTITNGVLLPLLQSHTRCNLQGIIRAFLTDQIGNGQSHAIAYYDGYSE